MSCYIFSKAIGCLSSTNDSAMTNFFRKFFQHRKILNSVFFRMTSKLNFHWIKLAVRTNQKIYYLSTLGITIEEKLRLQAIMPPAFQNLYDDKSFKKAPTLVYSAIFCGDEKPIK